MGNIPIPKSKIFKVGRPRISELRKEHRGLGLKFWKALKDEFKKQGFKYPEENSEMKVFSGFDPYGNLQQFLYLG